MRAGRLVDELRALHVLQHDDELVAAHAHDDVFVAHGGANALRDRLQQLVADFVAARVVDVLEAIEIQEQHREQSRRCASPPRWLRADARRDTGGSAGR